MAPLHLSPFLLICQTRLPVVSKELQKWILSKCPILFELITCRIVISIWTYFDSSRKMFDTKYNFEGVLVANTSLLLPANSDKNVTSIKQPDILVLNNKLNKCPKSQLVDSPPCLSCCLQIESPEFRRRSNVATLQNNIEQCLAYCSDKRSVNIELKAKAQMSGKLVILAVTEVEGSQLSCRLENSWSFSKFNPKLQNYDQQQANRNKQTYFAKLKSHQVPTLSVTSMVIDRNIQTGIELISLTLESERPNNSQQLVSRETLLVNKFSCWPTNDGSNKTIDSSIMKSIHLLALINREPPSISSQTNLTKPVEVRLATALEKQASSNIQSMNFPSKDSGKNHSYVENKEDDKPKVTTRVPTEPTLVGTRLDNEAQQNKRAVLISSKPTTTNNPITILMLSSGPTIVPRRQFELSSQTSNEDNSNSHIDTFQTTTFSQRIDSTPIIDQPKATSPKTILFNAGLFDSGLPKLGPPYITELDSIRMRLKSNSLLAITVSSFFVILTYTLCLLVYLKSRQRHQIKTNSTSSATSSKRILKSSSKDSPDIDISKPFNLQMAPATKTRLDMMLGLNKKKKDKRHRMTSSRGHQHSFSQEISSNFGDSIENHHYSRCLRPDCLVFSQPEHFNNQLYEDVPEFDDSNHSSFDPFAQNHFISDICQNQQYYTYAPINVVDAIKEAATMAKIRFKTSSFKPNLNVIPESDLEYLNNSPKDELAMLASFLTNNNLDNELLSSDQFESLVQEAMSTECSHVGNELIYEQGATLFSKPQMTFPPITTDQSVSRSRILQQVKNPPVSEECIYGSRKDAQ